MALFTSNPEKVLQRDLDAARTSRDAIAKRLAAAQDKVHRADEALQRLVREGAQDPALVSAERALDEAERRVSTLQPALAEAKKLLTLLESQLAEALDAKVRRETALQCEKLADDLEEVAKDIDPVLERMVEITARAKAGEVWDAAGLHTYAESSKGQIPAAIAAVAQALRQHGIRVMANMERATLLAPAEPANMVAAVEPAVSKVFTTENVSWTDAQGQTRTAGKYSDIDLPVKTAARALASGICREIGSDIWRAWSGSKGFVHPDPSECTNLDSIAEVIKLNDAPIDAQFVRIDRGKPFEVSVVSRKA